MKSSVRCDFTDIGCNTIPGVQSYLVSAPTGTTLFRPGDSCRNGLVVLSGRVRVGRLTATGHELVLYRVGAGEACAITTTCLLGEEVYPAHAHVKCPVLALALPPEVFRRHLCVDECFRTVVFRHHARAMGDLIRRIESITSERIEVRLARCLLERADPSLVAATHEEIAGDIGTTREVVSRNLKLFERQGWVRLHRKSIEVVDRGRLRSLDGAD